MANEVVRVYGSTKTLEANGASVASNDVAQANDADYDVAADGANFPDAEFVLSCTLPTTTGIENRTVGLYARELDIDGAADAQSPESGASTFKGRSIGSFVVNDIATLQYASLVAYDVPQKASYYIHNATGQGIDAGWTLKVKPRTVAPAA